MHRCQHVLRAYVLTCQRVLHAYVIAWLRAYVPTCLAWSCAHVLTCLSCLLAHLPMCLSWLRAHVTSNNKNKFSVNYSTCLVPAKQNCIWKVHGKQECLLEHLVWEFSSTFLDFSYQAEAFNGCYYKLCTIKWFDLFLSRTLRVIFKWLINDGRWIIMGGRYIYIYIYIYIYYTYMYYIYINIYIYLYICINIYIYI